jgi:hypothetical protein
VHLISACITSLLPAGLSYLGPVVKQKWTSWRMKAKSEADPELLQSNRDLPIISERAQRDNNTSRPVTVETAQRYDESSNCDLSSSQCDWPLQEASGGI